MQQQSVNRKIGAAMFLWPWPVLPAASFALLVGSFLYVWLRVEPLLEYHASGPYFYRDADFLHRLLRPPGGLADYVGVFLAQLNCLNGLGALVFALTGSAILVLTRVCLARIAGRPPGLGALVPLFVLLLLRNHYGCPVATLGVGLVLALAAAAAHGPRLWRRPWLSAVVSGLISGLLFSVAGVWSALLYAVLCCLFGGFRERSWPAGLSCVVLAMAAPLLMWATGQIALARLLNPWGEGVDGVLAAVLYASVPAAAVVLVRLPVPMELSTLNPEPAAAGRAARAPKADRRFLEAGWSGQTIVLVVFVLGGAVVWLRFDLDRKLEAAIDYHSARGQHASVIEAAQQAQALSYPAKVRLQRALYHSGRLAEDLFLFLNRLGEAPSIGIGEDWRAQIEPLFDLGLINDAEHMAHEALEIEGKRPDLLRFLARINQIKNRPEAAQVFLNVLSLVPFQGERANDDWPAIGPQARPGHASLDQIRPRLMTNDVPHDSVGPLLDVLLAVQPTNRMAFEYVMAHYLMDLDLAKVAERVRLLDNFHDVRIPRPYEEALLLYQQISGSPVELNGRALDADTIARFQQFRDTARRMQGAAGGPAFMAAHFGDTYWFYYYANLLRKQAP